MKKSTGKARAAAAAPDKPMREEYDFSKAVRLRDTPKYRRWLAAAERAKTAARAKKGRRRRGSK